LSWAGYSVYLSMAKWLLSTPPFVGTKDGVTVYQLPGGKYYARMKSSITTKRIKKDPAFKAFRNSSVRMTAASPLASFVYKQLAVKHYPLYREMTGKALLWLKAGISPEEITERLMKEYLEPKPIVKLPEKPLPGRIFRRVSSRVSYKKSVTLISCYSG
jgi:hypothetical protein